MKKKIADIWLTLVILGFLGAAIHLLYAIFVAHPKEFLKILGILAGLGITGWSLEQEPDHPTPPEDSDWYDGGGNFYVEDI